MKKADEVYETLALIERKKNKGVSASDISNVLGIDRSNISRYLNELFKESKLKRIEGRPVLFKTFQEEIEVEAICEENSLNRIVGGDQSLSIPIQQAKAAILYPPRGLHVLLLGETGVGKSMFAELMYMFAIESKVIHKKAPFITFNCADYADNPQLVISQIFGVKRGAYTGAERDREGLLKKADGGILFLDEVHRLSPQGQEMLFMYIDKGYFRPLGDTENLVVAKVQILAATTEEPNSYLLKTFTRRIPMCITLPPLRKRSISERYCLIEEFIREESKRIGTSIYINKNSLISYLLYDCFNNIGQLKSDIQLACAKAFLSYKANKAEHILINQSDLPNHVKKGLMKIKENRKEIQYIFKDKGDILKFYHWENLNRVQYDEYQSPDDFYNIIEKKLESLKSIGLEDKELNDVLNIDIESYFKKYIVNLPKKYISDELLKIVGVEIVEIVEEILAFSEKTLNKVFEEKIYFGLALHLQRSIERIRNGERIYNPKLNFIRVNYESEFLLAMKVAKIIDERFLIETPVDEIGYLTMFLASNNFDDGLEETHKVKVIVIMHGISTASSMVDVANELMGNEYGIGLNMPLSMRPETMYDIVKEKIINIDNGKGVLLLVDMGSLTNFGDMVYEDTGINVKTIDMVSTPLVIDALRKSVMGYELDEIYTSIKNINININNRFENKTKRKKNMIITACFTGDGASKRLRDIIKEDFVTEKELEINALDIIDSKVFKDKVIQYQREYNVLAIVGTVDIKIEDIPFISAIDVLNGEGIEEIKKYITEEEMYKKVRQSLKSHMNVIDGERVVGDVKKVIEKIEMDLNVKLASDVQMGIVLHISFLIDKLCSGEKTKEFEDIEEYKKNNLNDIKIVKECLRPLERTYNIKIGDNELAYINRLFILNNAK